MNTRWIVIALAVASFSVGTAEFIVSGLLPALAADLGVSIPVAGLLVTGYAACVAIASPFIAALTARVSRRTLLIAVLAVFILGQVLCALAASYPMLLGARLLVACAHGMFFSVGLTVVGRVSEPGAQGSAFALFFGGLTLSTIFGVPVGTAIGAAFGWRAAFWFVGALSTIAAIAAIYLVPRDPASSEGQGDIRLQLRQLAQQKVFLSFVAIAFNCLGYFCFVTYQVPLLGQVTGIPQPATPIFLLIGGAGTVAGTVLSAKLVDWRIMFSLQAVTLCEIAIFVAMFLFAAQPIAMAVLMFLGGVCIACFATPVQARIVNAASAAPSLATALISTSFNVGIAGGALSGAILLDRGLGYPSLFVVGAIALVFAAATIAVSWRLEGRTALA